MKTRCVNIFQVTLVIFAFTFVFVSCQKDNIDSGNRKGKVVFSLSTEKATLLKSTDAYSLDSVVAVVVSIKDQLDNYVYENEVIHLVRIGGEFISEPISLIPDNYTLSSFMLIDGSNKVLFITPLTGSKYAYLVSTPLEINFSITKDATTKLVPEVISTEDATPNDFGYSTFSFIHIKTFDFLISTFAANGGSVGLTKSWLTISHNGNIVFRDSLDAVTNNIRIPEITGNYSFLITKAGYRNYSRTFTLDSLKAHASPDYSPLLITLYRVSEGLLLWNKLGSIEEIANSEVGPGIQLVNYIYPSWFEAQIAPGIFGNGLFINHDTYEGWVNDGANFFAIDNHSLGLSPVRGSIEFWFKFRYNCSQYNHALFFATANSLIGHFASRPTSTNTDISGIWNGWDYGSYGKRYAFGINSKKSLTQIAFTSDYSVAPGGSLEFYTDTEAHLAFVWDINGIDGTSETMRIYVNGIVEGASNGIWNTTVGMNNFLFLGTTPNYDNWDHYYNAVKGVMDNIKIWNYAKTHFSDRFSE